MKGCRSCSHWQSRDIDLDRIDPATTNQKVQLGVCRRHAPRPGSGSPAAPESLETMAWPRVASDDWCGEWEPDLK